MHVLGAVEMLLLDPEGAADAPVILHPVPERPVVGLIGVAGPGVPAGEFALGSDRKVRAVQEGGFGNVVHGKEAFSCEQRPLNPIHPQCANAVTSIYALKALDS